MTKEEALKRIEELKMYVADCDKPKFRFGDVLATPQNFVRIVVHNNKGSLVAVDEGGYRQSSMPPFRSGFYTVIGNVFDTGFRWYRTIT